MSIWDDPEQWAAARSAEACPICQRGQPLDVIAEYESIWVTAGREAPSPGYVCAVSKQHVVEPFELPAQALEAFWREAMLVARRVAECLQPTKMNYEIHGNTIPHLHMHLFPRFAGGPSVVRPGGPRQAVFMRSLEELDRLRAALLTS